MDEKLWSFEDFSPSSGMLSEHLPKSAQNCPKLPKFAKICPKMKL
jgi:hypothetical protein